MLDFDQELPTGCEFFNLISRSLPLVPLEDAPPPPPPTAPTAAAESDAIAESDVKDTHQTRMSPTSNQKTGGSSIQQTDV